MEEDRNKKFICKDEHGNIMRLVLEPQEKYTTRYDLKYYFNDKEFKLFHFPSWRDASTMWDLLKLISKNKGGDDAKDSN